MDAYLDDKEFVKTMDQTRPAPAGAAADLKRPLPSSHRRSTEATYGAVAEDLRKRKRFTEERKLYE
jgi:hypothetical protein